MNDKEKNSIDQVITIIKPFYISLDIIVVQKIGERMYSLVMKEEDS